MTESDSTAYNRASLMDLAEHLADAPGIDMLVNLPASEQIQDIRIAELIPRAEGESKGPAHRGVLCTTNERLLFFLRVPEVSRDRDLATATGYLVECLLRRKPLDRERAARYFPKKETAILDLRRQMAELYFPDLLPVVGLPLAGLAAILPTLDSSQQAIIDLEVDLRAEGGLLRRLIQLNPQLRLVLGPRYAERPYPEPNPSLPLVAACGVQELVELVDRIRECQSAIDFDSLPSRLFDAPWAISLLSGSPRAKVSLVHHGDQSSGKAHVERGHLVLTRTLKKTQLFNVGAVDDLGWDEESAALTIKGPGLHYRLQGEARSAQFAWIRAYLMELFEIRRSLWEDPFQRGDLEPDAKPDPVGELLRYHLEPCNDPAVYLKDRLELSQVDRFMDGFGQLLPPDETPQGLVLMASPDDFQTGLLFTERSLYVRKRDMPGERIPFQRVAESIQQKKGFLSTSISFGPLAFKLESLGKETGRALFQALKAVNKRAG